MEPLTPYNEIIGDDLGYRTVRLSAVPDGYGFESVKPHDDCPLTKASWTKFTDFAKRYYRHFEIVGRTYQDFADNLQVAYDLGADTLERQLEVYQDDIAKPILGRTEKTTYDLTNNDSDNGTDTETVKIEGSGTNSITTTNNLTTSTDADSQTNNIDVPIDATNPNSQTPSTIVKTDGTETTTNTGTVKNESSDSSTQDTTRNATRQNTGEHKQTGTVTTELSDLGVRPNYESLNGFIDNNRTDVEVFCWLFRNCFAFNDVLTW